MNKKLFVLTFVLVLLLSLTAIPSFAQGGNPPENRGQGGQQQDVLADLLGVSVEELNARLAEGATLAELYEEAGLDVPYFGLENSQLAAALGISVDELMARLDAGETLEDLHMEAGLDMYSFEMGTRSMMNQSGGNVDGMKGNGDGTGVLAENTYQQRIETLAQALGMSEEALQLQLDEYFGEYFMQAGIPLMGNGRGVDDGVMPFDDQGMGGQGAGAGAGQGGRGPGAAATDAE